MASSWKKGDWVQPAVWLLIILVAWYLLTHLADLIKGIIDGLFGKDTAKNTVAWWKHFFDPKENPPAPDQSGVVGVFVSDNAQSSTYLTSQGYYDAMMGAYAKAHGLGISLNAQSDPGWGWHSYLDWYGAGFPKLPS